MKKDQRNVAASVGARLMNRAKQTGDDYQRLLVSFCLERFLYRLGTSSVHDRFVLKGASGASRRRSTSSPRFASASRTAGRDDKRVTYAVLKTVAAFLNTEGGDLLIGVGDDGAIVGIEHDQLETDDKFMRHLTQVVRNGLRDRASTCIDPAVQIVQDRTVCVVSCQRSPEPVFLKWKGMEASPDGDFYVRTGPGSVRLAADSAREYIRTRFTAT